MGIFKGDVREPAVAGQFYPGNPERLREQVDRLLEDTRGEAVEGEVVGLIAPHAGYAYSGQTAAYAYRQVAGQTFDVVIVMAPNHYDDFKGVSVSVYPGKAYRTPLGVVPVDGEMAERIAGRERRVRFTALGHRDEHALEVQLPFLQRTVEDLKIVPIVMADRSLDLCQGLAAAIAEAAQGRRALIVASSDLYHGYSYDECVASDETTLGAIERFDPEGLCWGLADETYQACGGGPISVALMAARRLGADGVRVVHRTNSNDVTRRRGGYVVGYGAAVVYRSAGKGSEREDLEDGVDVGLSPSDRETLLRIARTTIEHQARGEDAPEVKADSAALRAPKGAFVSLHKGGLLRGCIGYVHAQKPLYQTVMEVAEAAAVRDPRFPPVSPDEVGGLEIEISVLTPLRTIRDVEEIEVGRHGLLIRRDRHQGLLLPQVATEYQWDRRTFLEHVCQKAGLPKDAWRDRDAEIQIFSAEVFGESLKH